MQQHQLMRGRFSRLNSIRGDECSKIPPTEVGGWFKSSLQTKNERCFREYHPPQWVDRSSSAYKRRTSAASGNTHGGGWIVQVQPT